MKLFLLAIVFVLFGVGFAHAACPGSLILQDAVGTQVPAKYLDDGSGNCIVVMDTSSSGNLINAVKSPLPLGTTGGWTPVLKTALTNSPVAIKSAGGWLGFAQCDNNNSTWSYIQVYNILSGSVTVGASTPIQVVPLAPGLSGGFSMTAIGMEYATAITVAATTTAVGSGAPSTAINCTFGFN